MTFLPQFASPGDPHASGKLLVLGAIFLVIANLVCIPMVMGAGRFSSAIRSNPRISRSIDWVFASVFTGFAVHIMFSRAR